jgi:hypothetical protein
MVDELNNEDVAIESTVVRAKTLAQGLSFNPDEYAFDDIIVPDKLTFTPAKSIDEVHTCAELVHFAEKEKEVEIDARVLHLTDRGFEKVRLDKSKFIETFKSNNVTVEKFRESYDAFSTDGGYGGSNAGLVGDDYIPLLGGPFNKQLYYYDYLRMHAIAFNALHHDPLAKRIVNIIVDFTLGKGWRVDCKNKDALALWRAFEEVNNLYDLMLYLAKELSTYGEVMIWELPNNDTKIQYRVYPGQEAPKGLIPRIRLIDPSVIWEIVTFPEDISRVLYYQWVAPTQYQTYSGTDAGKPVTTTKFIYDQIPAEEVMHYKINCVSNEKRGRSDLFPILGYLKRARDIVNCDVIAAQKNAAWAIDTTIEGSQVDIDNYIAQQQALGTFAPMGSEFVHSKAVQRQYLSNASSTGKANTAAFQNVLSMIAIGSGIPASYLGTLHSAGQNKASALVGTEPVAKMFEMRQFIYEQILKKLAKRLFNKFGYDDDIEVTFPEIITQDRSAKLKDLALAEEMRWISQKRAATMASKEFGVSDYEWETEKQEIANSPAPLTTPGTLTPTPPTAPVADDNEGSTSAVTSEDREDYKDNYDN